MDPSHRGGLIAIDHQGRITMQFNTLAAANSEGLWVIEVEK